MDRLLVLGEHYSPRLNKRFNCEEKRYPSELHLAVKSDSQDGSEICFEEVVTGGGEVIVLHHHIVRNRHDTGDNWENEDDIPHRAESRKMLDCREGM